MYIDAAFAALRRNQKKNMWLGVTWRGSTHPLVVIGEAHAMGWFEKRKLTMLPPNVGCVEQEERAENTGWEKEKKT